MDYEICEVDGQLNADILRELSANVPEWPLLEHRHLKDGYWWIALGDDADDPVAFAGLVPMTPFNGYGYFKRSFVSPLHRGRGIQFRLIMAIELKCRQLGWTHIVAECEFDNESSIRNLRRAGFDQTNPEQRWGVQPALYWLKAL